MAVTSQYCTFRVERLHLGIEVMKVQEVIRHQEMTVVPRSPEVVRGLINLRGQIVVALDLRRRLGLPPSTGENQLLNVVVRDGDGPVALLVDEIGDVLELDDSTFERPPQTLKGAVRAHIRGIHKLPSGLLLVLDVERVLSLSPHR